ncbi:MAG: hypothetical protein CL949_15465 [Erythrobacter sp.]|nr:hypothetical protein [Erythrobacter sp.]
MSTVNILSGLPLVAIAFVLGAYWHARTGFLFGAHPYLDEAAFLRHSWKRAAGTDIAYPAHLMQHYDPHSLIIQNVSLSALVEPSRTLSEAARRELFRIKADFVVVEKATSRAVKAYLRPGNPHAGIIRHALSDARIAAEIIS